MHPALLGPSEASTWNDFVEVLVQKYFTQSLYFEMVKFQEVGQLKRPNQTCFKHFKKETQHFFHWSQKVKESISYYYFSFLISSASKHWKHPGPLKVYEQSHISSH